MGLGLVMIWPIMVAELAREALILLFTGGALYIIGIVFFILGEYKPIYHTIWHVFVVAAAATHWFGVYFFVIQLSLEDSVAKAAVEDLVDSVSAAATVTANLVNAATNMTYH
jgi:hypothetical protein